MKYIIIFCLLVLMNVSSAFAQLIGQNTMRMADQDKAFFAETGGYLNRGAGMGAQFRFLARTTEMTKFDVVAGAFDGRRTSRIFIGFEQELFESFSVKEFIGNDNQFGESFYSAGFAPIAHFPAILGSVEFFPYVSLPLKMVMNSNTNVYSWTTIAAFGLNAPLNLDWHASAEGNVDLSGGASSVMMGVGKRF
jgi:hypothetical protein